MRFTPLVGRKAWFGPRRFGWGWDPASWEGWVALAVWIVVMFSSVLLPQGWQGVGALGAAAGLIVTCILTGTRPGGPEAADRFREARRIATRTPQQIEADRRLRQATPDAPSVTDAARRMQRVPKRRDG